MAMDSRLRSIRAVVPMDDLLAQVFLDASEASRDKDPTDIIDGTVERLLGEGKITSDRATQIKFANTIANMSGDNVSLMKAADSSAVANLARNADPARDAKEVEPPSLENVDDPAPDGSSAGQ